VGKGQGFSPRGPRHYELLKALGKPAGGFLLGVGIEAGNRAGYLISESAGTNGNDISNCDVMSCVRILIGEPFSGRIRCWEKQYLKFC
jgi:hypothetical protein